MSFKSKYIIIPLLIIAIFAPFFAYAAVLEVGIPGQIEPGARLPGLTDYMRYIYWFMLGTVGIAAFVSLVWYGVLWIYSGIVEQKSEALEGIKNTFLGLGLAFGAYIILYTINPDLVSFTTPGAPIPDVKPSDKTSAASVTTVTTAPPSKESIQVLAQDILTSKSLSFFSSSEKALWNACSGLYDNKTIIIDPKDTIERMSKSSGDSPKIISCRAGCSSMDNPSTRYCTSLVSLSKNMIQTLSQIARTDYKDTSPPSLQIIEITGGDRVLNDRVKAHYEGRAIDVKTPPPTGYFDPDLIDAPGLQNSGYVDEYTKIVSAFSGPTAAKPKKIECVDRTEFALFELSKCDPAKNQSVDHLHIEW